MLDIDHHLIARQMRRQRTVIAGRASAMGSGFGAISRFGRLLSQGLSEFLCGRSYGYP
jgi:hypothetical protein